MELEVLERLARVLVGVAVFAAVETGVVRADVVRFDAVAARTDALVLELAEGDAVGAAEDVERHAAGRADAEARVIAVRAAGLDREAETGGGRAEEFRQLVPVGIVQRDDLRHIELDLLVHFDETEDAAVDVRREAGRHACERLLVAFDGVRLREQDGVVAPRDAVPPDDRGEFRQRLHALVDAWHARLHVAAVRRDRVETIRAEAVRDLADARQDRAVVLRTEHHAVDDRRVQFPARDLVREERIPGQHIALREPVQQPVREILDRVGPPARINNHDLPLRFAGGKNSSTAVPESTSIHTDSQISFGDALE